MKCTLSHQEGEKLAGEFRYREVLSIHGEVSAGSGVIMVTRAVPVMISKHTHEIYEGHSSGR
jgi:hypothetical protein